MASDNNDIGDMVKKCKILLLDIEGTTTSISFVKDKLFPYAEENVQEFLNQGWESDDVKEAVTALRKLALEDQENSVDGVVTIPGEDATKEEQIKGLVKSVKWQMSSDRKVGPLKLLQGLIWKQGYDKGDIKGHVYDDVLPALELWRSVEGQKVYIYSSGSVQAQKLLFAQSLAGDMLKYIDGHFDTAVGAKQEATSYAAIAEKIGSKPEEILFLTDIVKEAEAARSSGLHTALVSREGNAPLSTEATAAFAVLHSFAQLATSNKRKPDAQDRPEDVQPAKVPKTDVDADVKTASDSEVASEPEKKPETETTDSVPPKVTEEPEKMEVEEDQPAKVDASTEKVEPKVETTVKEITDSNEIGNAVVCDIEPVIEEYVEKTGEKETAKMETESNEDAKPAPEPKESAELKTGDQNVPNPEETPSTVITEIEEITTDKQNLEEVADITEALQPVVEEPAQEMEDLQNVGEVLDKECDEILSKVQDVTNLDSIPVKPLLNSIAEESMETENTDTNDIVERILDTEMEMEMKQAEKAALNGAAVEGTVIVQEDKDEKTEIVNKEVESVGSQETSTDKASERTKLEEGSSVAEKKVEVSKSQDEIIETKVATEVSTPENENNVNSEAKKETEVKVNTDSKEDTEIKVETEIKGDTDSKEVKEKQETKTESTDTDMKEESETKLSTETKVDTETKIDNETKQDMETKVATETNGGTDSKVPETKDQVEKKDAEEKKNEANKNETEKTEKPTEQSTMETDKPTESKENDKVTEDVKPEQMNGKTTNGDAEMLTLNGDAGKEDELSSRLSMENGKKEVVNGANGDSNDADQTKNGKNVEVAEIKVKTVAIDEPRNDPIEQPTEA